MAKSEEPHTMLTQVLLSRVHQDRYPSATLMDMIEASIPQAGGAESLNVAMAGTIALYEWSRTAGADTASRSQTP